jgi:hypothetical protein
MSLGGEHVSPGASDDDRGCYRRHRGNPNHHLRDSALCAGVEVTQPVFLKRIELTPSSYSIG